MLLNGCATTRTIYLKEHPNTSQDIKNAILKGEVILGMNNEQVIASQGMPSYQTYRPGHKPPVIDFSAQGDVIWESAFCQPYYYDYSYYIRGSSCYYNYYEFNKEGQLIRFWSESEQKKIERENSAKGDEYFRQHPERESFKDSVKGKKIKIGMTKEEVELSWGKPSDINRTVTQYSTHEQWVYGKQYLYFEDNILNSWQD